jgi:hypothetical protein
VCQRGEDLCGGEHGGGERRRGGWLRGTAARRDGCAGPHASAPRVGAARSHASLSGLVGSLVRIGMVGCLRPDTHLRAGRPGARWTVSLCVHDTNVQLNILLVPVSIIPQKDLGERAFVRDCLCWHVLLLSIAGTSCPSYLSYMIYVGIFKCYNIHKKTSLLILFEVKLYYATKSIQELEIPLL